MIHDLGGGEEESELFMIDTNTVVFEKNRMIKSVISDSNSEILRDLISISWDYNDYSTLIQ